MALTDTAVRQAKPAEKEFTLSDGQGLALVVPPRASKYWAFRFSWLGKQARISLGTYPEVSLRDAREKRDEFRALVARGVDPRQHRREQRHAQAGAAANTFEAVANRWWDFRAPRLTDGRKGSRAQSRRYLDKDLLPVLGRMQMTEITRADVLSAVRRVEARGALNVAEKCRTWLNQIFRFAMAEGVVDQNPASDLDIVAVPQPPVRHNPILREDGLPELLRALRQYQGSIVTRVGIRLLLLTGVRTIELRQASWDQFDLEEGIWRVPAEGVKQLRSRVRTEGDDIPPYLVPLSRQAIEALREIRPVSAKFPYVLPGRNDPRQMISENTLNGAIRRMGFKGRLTGHGLRGTISTALNEQGFNRDHIEAQLSHADPNKSRDSYNHAQYITQRREMMQWWADHLDRLEADSADGQPAGAGGTTR